MIVESVECRNKELLRCHEVDSDEWENLGKA